MNDKLHQINVSYQSKEDRLLLKVTTFKGDEFRVWLSRRFTGLLFNVLNKEMDKHGGITSIGNTDNTKNLFKAGAFDKKFNQEKTKNFPLGEEGFLAYAIKTNNTEDGNLILEISPERGMGVTLNLTASMLYMLHNLLNQGCMRAEWNKKILDSVEQTSKHVH